MSIGFIGFQGVGKTRWAARLAQRLNLCHVDTDVLIERDDRLRRSCREIFRAEGECYFRSKEREILRSLETVDSCVISFGGGSDPEMASRMCKRCIYLYASRELAYQYMCVKGGIFLEDNFENFYLGREKRYRLFADTTIDVAYGDVFSQVLEATKEGVYG